MSDRPYSIHGGRFGTAARGLADRVFGPVKRVPPPTYEEVIAEIQRREMENPTKPDKPLSIHGGKFGTAARKGMDKFIAVGNEVPAAFSNYGEGHDQGLQILFEYLRQKFGQ